MMIIIMTKSSCSCCEVNTRRTYNLGLFYRGHHPEILARDKVHVQCNYSVSEKNTPDIFSCNLNKYFLIEIIFWHKY